MSRGFGRRGAGVLAAGGLVVAVLAPLGHPAGAAAAPVWSDAAPVTFDATDVNATPTAEFRAVSCGSPGNCTAVGYLVDANGRYQAFTVSSVNGVWGTARKPVFADGVQSANPYSEFEDVSCASAGNCTAVGFFYDVAGNQQAFSQTSTNGAWGAPTPAAFAAGVEKPTPYSSFASVSCVSAGNCTAVGYFWASNDQTLPFSQTSTNGVWADGVPATFPADTLYFRPDAEFTAVSCVSAGNCTAVGFFKNLSNKGQPFSQTSTNGTWSTSVPADVSGITPYNGGRFTAVSCGAGGDCTAVGSYSVFRVANYAIRQTSSGGVWGAVQTLGVSAALPNPPGSYRSVSCPSAGNCVAVGFFQDGNGYFQAFTQTSSSGTWSAPVASTNNTGAGLAEMFESVSCVSAGDCTAAGSSRDANGRQVAVTQTSTGGQWGPLVPSTFTSTLEPLLSASIFADVSCSSAGNCTVVGNGIGNTGDKQVFTSSSATVVNTPAAPTQVTVRGVGARTAQVFFVRPTDDGGSAITDYDVEYSTNPAFEPGSGTFVEAGTSVALRLPIAGLAPRTTYYVRVRASNANGDGDWSAVSRGFRTLGR